MELIRNNKGGLKLCLDGYMYIKKYTKVTTKRWQCSQKDARDCTGAVVTDLEVSRAYSAFSSFQSRRLENVEKKEIVQNEQFLSFTHCL